jgi:hypothetical protein
MFMVSFLLKPSFAWQALEPSIPVVKYTQTINGDIQFIKYKVYFWNLTKTKELEFCTEKLSFTTTMLNY